MLLQSMRQLLWTNRSTSCQSDTSVLYSYLLLAAQRLERGLQILEALASPLPLDGPIHQPAPHQCPHPQQDLHEAACCT